MMAGVAEAEQEQARVRALHELSILDTEREPEFDDLVSLASAICGVPMSFIAMMDTDRLWLKAWQDVPVQEIPRSISFCNHALRQDGLLLVEDARLDSRFCDNPLVTGEARLRFYAGMPLRTPEGFAVGTLCVLDREPKCLTEQQRKALRILSDQVSARLELRAKRQQMEALLEENQRTHAETQALEHRFQSFMDSGPFMSYIKDVDGRMLYYNRPMAERFGVSREFMLGKLDAELWPADHAELFRAHDRSVIESGMPMVIHERTRDENGVETTWQSHKFPGTGRSGEPLLCGISLDVTSQLQKEEELMRVQRELTQANMLLQQLAATDSLTGVASRRVFDERLRLGFREARKKSEPLSLLMLDVDNFKRHNDTFGHQHGDEVLRRLAACMLAELRPTDCFARYGGEEFAIIAPFTPESGAMSLASRLLETVRFLLVDGQAVTVSIGLCELTGDVVDTAELIARADHALAYAKAQGKDRALAWCEQSIVVAV